MGVGHAANYMDGAEGAAFFFADFFFAAFLAAFFGAAFFFATFLAAFFAAFFLATVVPPSRETSVTVFAADIPG